MLLKEISQGKIKRLVINFFTSGNYEITDEQIYDVVRQIVPGFDPDHTPSHDAHIFYPPGGEEITAVSLPISSPKEVNDIVKLVRRLSRGKQRFKWDYELLSFDVFDENANPGSGSPIRESIPDRFVIDFFPDDEDESTIRRLHTRVENMLGQMVPPESVQIFYPETEAFIISASIPVRSREEAENIIKKVRRLSREKPRFRWSYDETQLSDIYDDTFENVNPGSGSPIRAGSMDLTPLSDKQKMQLVSRKGRYWRMSVRELKDALMQHKGNSREVSRINQVLKAKREKREELSKITQPIDSWRGGGGY